MNLRLKIYLMFLGVVFSIASLGYLGLSFLTAARQAEADLRQLNSQRILLNRVWSDLDAALAFSDRMDTDSSRADRGELESRVRHVFRSLDDLKSSGLESEGGAKLLELRADVMQFWQQLLAQREEPSDSHSVITLVIRKREQALSQFFDEKFVKASLDTSDHLREAYLWFFAAVVSGVVLSAGFGFFLHRLLLVPLGELKDAADQVRLGNRHVTFSSGGEDEFARVGDAFEKMSEEIDRQFEAERTLREKLDTTNARLATEKADFERLVEVGKVISSALEWRQVLQLLTTTASEMIPCKRCSVIEPNKSDDGRAKILSSQLHEQGGPIRIDLQRYPEIQAVSMTRQTVEIDDAWADPRFESHREELVKAGVRSMLAVPMMRQGNLLAVLSFIRSDNHEGQFTAWERRVAETIAGIGAVCMENSGLFTNLLESRNEVQDLNSSLRKNIEELRETRDRLVASERMAAVGEMAASVAHSLRNPLAAIRATAQACEDGPSQESMGSIVTLVDRMGRHLNQILDFSQTGDEYRTSVDACAVVADAASLLRSRAEHGRKEIQVVSDGGDGVCIVTANPERFERAILAVMENAVEATPEGEPVQVTTVRDGDDVRIEVCDRGEVIEVNTLARVFEPFFTTKPRGTGLGTTIASKVVHSLGGDIEMFSDDGQGTRVVITIPGATG